MTIKDESVLNEFRNRGECEMCWRRVKPLDPHHAFKKRGMGGGSRLDVRENLLAVCRVCHIKADEAGYNQLCREHIARRHGTTVESIMDWLNLILRTPNNRPIPARPWSVAA